MAVPTPETDTAKVSNAMTTRRLAEIVRAFTYEPLPAGLVDGHGGPRRSDSAAAERTLPASRWTNRRKPERREQGRCAFRTTWQHLPPRAPSEGAPRCFR